MILSAILIKKITNVDDLIWWMSHTRSAILQNIPVGELRLSSHICNFFICYYVCLVKKKVLKRWIARWTAKQRSSTIFATVVDGARCARGSCPWRGACQGCGLGLNESPRPWKALEGTRTGFSQQESDTTFPSAQSGHSLNIQSFEHFPSLKKANLPNRGTYD